MPRFAIGERVRRVERREVTAATVLDIDTAESEPVYRIAYDEGGEGWWPDSTLMPASSA